MTDHNTPWVDVELERDRQEREYENELWDENIRHWQECEQDILTIDAGESTIPWLQNRGER